MTTPHFVNRENMIADSEYSQLEKSQRPIGFLPMPEMFGRIPWGHHIDISLTTCQRNKPNKYNTPPKGRKKNSCFHWKKSVKIKIKPNAIYIYGQPKYHNL